MNVTKEKLAKARSLRLAGASMREAARQAGISPTTLRKHEKGWCDTRGIHHAGWASDLDVVRIESLADAMQSGGELLDHEKRLALYASAARCFIEKALEALPRLSVKHPRESRQLMSEGRELLRCLDRAQDAERSRDTGVRHDLPYEEMVRRYQEAMALEVDEIEPPRSEYGRDEVPDVKAMIAGDAVEDTNDDDA